MKRRYRRISLKLYKHIMDMNERIAITNLCEYQAHINP